MSMFFLALTAAWSSAFAATAVLSTNPRKTANKKNFFISIQEHLPDFGTQGAKKPGIHGRQCAWKCIKRGLENPFFAPTKVRGAAKLPPIHALNKPVKPGQL